MTADQGTKAQGTMDYNTIMLATNDPFAPKAVDAPLGKIHIRVQQMGKKWITSIEGLDDDLDLDRIARAMKKTLNCAATVSMNKEGNEIIQLQGYQRDFIHEWLVVNEVMTEKEAITRLVIHGA